MSLQKKLKVAGYDKMSLYFYDHKIKDKYADNSSKNLKELIERYKELETDLLQFDSKKRDKTSKAEFIIFEAAGHLTLLKDNKNNIH